MSPVVIGIGGGSGAGKSWLAEALASRLQPLEVSLLRQDDYLRSLPEAVRENPIQHNFDHPDAYDWELLVAHLAALRAGRAVGSPLFDRRTHTRGEATRSVASAGVIVVEGLHVLAVTAIEKRLDLRVFVDTPADLRLIRRLEKDCSTRGRSWHQVTAQYLGLVRPMHERHVEPSRRCADLVVSGADDGTATTQVVCNSLRALLHLAF